MSTIRIISILALIFIFNTNYIAQDSLRFYYKFNSDLTDYSPNGFDGTSFNSAQYIGSECDQGFRIEDNNMNGVFVDGEAMNGLQDFTISALIKLNGFNSNNNLLSCANIGQDNELTLGYNSVVDPYEDGWHLRIDNTFYNFGSNKEMDDLEWHHFVLTRKGNTAAIYIDGNILGNPITVSDHILVIDPNGIIIGQDQDCVMGCFEDDQNWDGDIDEFKVFSVAIPENELDKLACVNVESFIEETVCSGDSVIINSETYSSEGTYTQTLISSEGLDSIINITIIEQEPINVTEDYTFCLDDGIQINHVIYTEPGIFEQDIIDNNGCNAVLSLNLTAIDCSSCGSSINFNRTSIEIQKRADGTLRIILKSGEAILKEDNINDHQIDNYINAFILIVENESQSNKEKKSLLNDNENTDIIIFINKPIFQFHSKQIKDLVRRLKPGNKINYH